MFPKITNQKKRFLKSSGCFSALFSQVTKIKFPRKKNLTCVFCANKQIWNVLQILKPYQEHGGENAGKNKSIRAENV